MISEHVAWRAVVGHDQTYEGEFVYGVMTTGVYCRASCGARRPKRENVRFFADPATAEAAGFRPCKRCLPDQNVLSLAERARQILDGAEGDELNLGPLASELRVSRFHLQRTFTRAFGVSPKQYIAAKRAERFRQRLKQGIDVTTATYDAGYGSSSAAYAASVRTLGMTPQTYRRGGEGMRIRYVIRPSAVGSVLIGMTDRGVCSLFFGDSDAELQGALRKEFPRATLLLSGDSDVLTTARAITAAIDGGSDAEVVLDNATGTPFQLLVWAALREVPSGATISYAELAVAVGRPSAVRAVARACASNRVAYIIPCHRVLPRAGGVGGYRWGAERKRELLRRETQAKKNEASED